jgi:hypothetical protein
MGRKNRNAVLNGRRQKIQRHSLRCGCGPCKKRRLLAQGAPPEKLGGFGFRH